MDKILVANRAEIALRIMKTIRKMGLKSVAVYSEADRHAPFVNFADEAICLGPPASKESYLRADKILDAARKFNVDAIHPGYGFLSENADFAESVNEAGFIFIGPSPYSINIMGSKLAAKEAVMKHNVPMLNGTSTAVTDMNEALQVCTQIGYPVIIKASAGGGGKGMRIVNSSSEVIENINRAQSEAMSSFGDNSVFIEKYITQPRHIEIQVLADQHGNIIHLFERDCSIQRRHQKVVEEAPSSIVDSELRNEMGKAAIAVAKSCGYVGAGTVEFLMDKNRKFYFLEMNTRLQVEHPVTEMITGIDLVEHQIRIARGEKLSLTQDSLQINGHAIELRVYAEDSFNNFMPSIGKLKKYSHPHGPGVRVDSGFREGMNVPIFYDPMISKLIVHAPTRYEAIYKMKNAIADYHIEGIQTTLPFGIFVMEHKAFREGDFDTHFISNYYTNIGSSGERQLKKSIAVKVAAYLFEKNKEKVKLSPNKNLSWKQSRLHNS